MVLLKFGIRKLFPDDFAPKDLQGVSLRHGVELFDLEALQKGCVGHERKAGFGQGHRCMMASVGLPVPLRGGAHRDFIPLAASVRWLERGEWKSDCVTWSDLYLSTSRGKKFARTLLSFDDIVCADRFTVGSSKWIAEDLADKICDPGSLIRPGFYAHPGLGLLKEPVLDAQAVFKIPQSVAPPEAN
jgi:hypothetical protein